MLNLSVFGSHSLAASRTAASGCATAMRYGICPPSIVSSTAWSSRPSVASYVSASAGAPFSDLIRSTSLAAVARCSSHMRFSPSTVSPSTHRIVGIGGRGSTPE